VIVFTLGEVVVAKTLACPVSGSSWRENGLEPKFCHHGRVRHRTPPAVLLPSSRSPLTTGVPSSLGTRQSNHAIASRACRAPGDIMKTVTKNPSTRSGVGRCGAQSTVFGWSRVRKMKKTIGSVTAFVAVALPVALALGVLLGAVNCHADSIITIEGYSAGTPVTLDNASGNYPVITAVLEEPGTLDGIGYGAWAFLVTDGTGSLEVYGQLPNGTSEPNPTQPRAMPSALRALGIRITRLRKLRR